MCEGAQCSSACIPRAEEKRVAQEMGLGGLGPPSKTHLRQRRTHSHGLLLAMLHTTAPATHLPDSPSDGPSLLYG